MRKLLSIIVSAFIFNTAKRKYIRDFIQNYSIIDYFRFKKCKYRVLSLGSICFPRVVTTYAKIKPRKIYGEKSSVFDLAYHSDINAEINLINNGFENYFDDIEFNTKENCWVNPSINALYNHDARLERDVFIEIYKKRIENFYDYINDNKFLLAVYSTSYVAKYTKEDIENLYDALKKKRGDKKFAFIVINHSQYLKDAKFDMENTLFIDISYFNMDNWADKVRKTKEGKELVKNIGNKIKKFMKSFDL